MSTLNTQVPPKRTSQILSSLLVVAFVVCAGILVFVLIADVLGLRPAPSSREQPDGSAWMNGIQVPNLAITGMTGRVTSLGDLAKDGALVGLFTTTCPHCLRTMPAWKELEDEAARVNVPFVAVSLHDQRRTWSFVNSTSSPQAVWVVSSREVSQRAGLPGVPFTVLVGEGGIIKETWLGALREKDIRNIVERLVDTRPAP